MADRGGLLRIAIRRLWAGSTSAPLLAAVVLAAASALAAGVVYGDAIADGALQLAVRARPPEEQRLGVRLLAPVGEIAQLDAIVRAELEHAIARPGGRVGLTARTVVRIERPRVPTETLSLAVVGGDGEVTGRATLASGRWPASLIAADHAPPREERPRPRLVEVALPAIVASQLGVGPGDRLTIVEPSRPRLEPPLELLVVGVWLPESSDPAWSSAPLEVAANEAGDLLGPAVVGLADVPHLARTVDLAWSAVPTLGNVRAVEADAVAADVAALVTRLPATLPRDRAPNLTLGLADALHVEARSALVGRASVLIVTLELAVLVLYGLLLLSSLLADRRLREAVLLRARGAGTSHVARLSVLEACLVALPVLVLGPFVAVGVVRIVGSVGPLGGTGLVAAAPPNLPVAGLVAAATVGFAVVAVGATAPGGVVGSSLAVVQAQLARAGRGSVAVRLGLDVVLVAATGFAIWQLQRTGGPVVVEDGILHLDPVAVGGPAVGLLAGTVVAVRVVPRLAELGQWVADRRRGVVVALALRQLARRPLRFLRIALLLMLAVGLTTFATAYAATWERSQRDQAAYEVASDLRVLAADYPRVPEWLAGAWYAGLAGVEAAGAVTRGSFDAGRGLRDAMLLGIEPEVVQAAFGEGPFGDPSLAAALDAVRAGRPSIPAVELPPGSRSLRIVVRADLSFAEETDVPASEIALLPQVRLLDGHGRLVRLDGRRIGGSAGEQVVEIPLGGQLGRDGGSAGDETEAAGVGATPPLRLLGLEIGVSGPSYIPIIGSFEVAEVDAVTGAGGQPVVRLPVPPPDGWSWTRTERPDFGSITSILYPMDPKAPGRITLVQPGPLPEPGFLDQIGPDLHQPDLPTYGSGTSFDLAATLPSDPILPAIVNRALVERAAVGPGDVLPIDTLGFRVRLQIAAVVERFAPLDPRRPFAVVDGPSLELAALAATRTGTNIDEWWLTAAPGQEAAVAAEIAAGPTAPAEVMGREARAATRLRDPIALGFIGALALASLTGLVFAGLGVVLGALGAAEERWIELAVLRALGLAGRDIVAWLVIEQVALVVVGLGGGLTIGLLVAWLVLPSLTLTPAGLPPVPPAVIVLPWPAIGLLVVAVPGLLLVVTLLLLGRTNRLEAAATIRATEL